MKAETKTETETKSKAYDIAIRIAVSPFIIGVGAVYLIFLWGSWVCNFFKYGGEVIAYDKSANRTSIRDVFNKLQEMDESLKEEKELDEAKAFVSKLHNMYDLGLIDEYLAENKKIIRKIKRFIE